MSEETEIKHSRKTKKGFKSFFKKPVVKIVLIVILVAVYSYGLFYLGQQSGAKKQKEIDAKKIAAATTQKKNSLPSMLNRKTFIGTVASISDKSIEIVPKTGNKTKVAINNETRVTGSDAQKTDVKAIKKDQKVIVSTTKDKDGKYTATRIRIQR